jgi:NTP pyrophosphatase (non-canonical NTP hydrolase)
VDTGKLDFDKYQELAMRTAGVSEGRDAQSMGGLGLGGEASELFELFLESTESFLKAARLAVLAGKTVDYLKKVVHHGHPLDKEKVKKELGDVLWYVALVANACGLSMNEIAEANIEKLKKRFPEGFSHAGSINRKADDK